MGATTFTIPSVFTAVDKFSGPMKSMGNAVQGFVGRSERLLGRANTAFSRLISPLTSINKLMMGLGFYFGLFTLIRVMTGAIDIMADFQQANVNLAVVMGVNVKNNKILADDARRIGLRYGEAATEVVKMQHALATLGFEQASILAMGKPLITGASALEGADPQKLAELVGAMVNTFDNLKDTDTQHILDVMSLSANKTALNFEKLATTLPIVAGPANALGITLEQTTALLGTLANAGIHVATSATSLKNIFIDSQKRGHTYAQMLDNVAKHADKLTYAYNKFGKRSVVSALVLSQKLRETAALQKELENAQLGLTNQIALDKINTFKGAHKLLNAAYQEFILSIEDGSGPLAQTLQTYLKVASAVLLFAAGSDQAIDALSQMDTHILITAKKWLFWVKAILWVSAVLIAAKVILFAWSAAIGIANIAMTIWKGLTIAFTAAQWLLNAAMAANPIGLIIIGVAALLALLGAAIAKFHDWGAAVLFLLGPLGYLPLAIMTVIDHWDRMVNAFTNEGILAGIKAIGATIADLILYPLQQILEIIAKITGADWASAAAKSIESFRVQIGGEDQSDVTEPKVSLRSGGATSTWGDGEANINGKVWLNINDPGKHVKDVISNSDWIMPQLSPTNTFSR